MNQSENVKDACNLLLKDYQGILCTNSKDMPGYPFGSVVPYIIDRQGQPVILISTIAQHTNNILSDNKVSLIVTEGDAADLQTVGRVTYIGDARKLDEQDGDAMERYYEFFPQSRDYHKTHDFDFYTIDLQRVRYIGGFGKIYWLEKDNFLMPKMFDWKEEQGMLNHMNKDHADAIRHYCDLYDIAVPEKLTPVMVGIDSEGFHIRIGKRIYRINFKHPVNTGEEVRKALVELARQDHAA